VRFGDGRSRKRGEQDELDACFHDICLTD